MAVVERFRQELMYGLSTGTKKSGRCREVAVSGGSTVHQSPYEFLNMLWGCGDSLVYLLIHCCLVTKFTPTEYDESFLNFLGITIH